MQFSATAYDHIVHASGILEKLAEYDARWVGTIPIDVHIPGSDIDIICHRSPGLKETITTHFGHCAEFEQRNNAEAFWCRFLYQDVPFEIYAEDKPSHRQLAWLHMAAEAQLLAQHGDALRQKVRQLKQQGMKTEPAFARILGLEGDPYAALLPYAHG